MNLKQIFSDTALLERVLTLSAADSLGSDSAGRNGVNVELQLVKSFNGEQRRTGGKYLLLTQRQLYVELSQQRFDAFTLRGEAVKPDELFEDIKREQRFEAVDLFLVKVSEACETLDIVDWASLKTAQLKCPKTKRYKKAGGMITLYNDPQGELANYFMGQNSIVDPQGDICDVYTIVCFRGCDGLPRRFSVLKAAYTPQKLVETFPHSSGASNSRTAFSGQDRPADLTFVDRNAVSTKKATSFNRGVKVRLSTMFEGVEGFEVLAAGQPLDHERILSAYNELYGLAF